MTNSQNQYLIEDDDLVTNPTSRLPICLVLDVSNSVSGEPLKQLQSGVNLFMSEIRGDELARFSAEIAIVTFGGRVRKELEFTAIDRQEAPVFAAAGNTPIGEALILALDMLEARKAAYSESGVDYYQPWLVVMSDGKASDQIKMAVDRITELVKSKKLTVFAIALSNSPDLMTLAKLSPDRYPLELQGLKFSEFFIWLSRSVSRVSHSLPGDPVALDVGGIRAWGRV